MLFNPTDNYDFVPNLTIDGITLESSDERKLLGLTIRNDLIWKSNTSSLTKRAYKKLWDIKRLKSQGTNLNDLIDIYQKQVWSILEFGVPVWNNGLTQDEVADIERVQKAFLHISLEGEYTDYQSAFELTKLETLLCRRLKLCKKFVLRSSKHPKHSKWFLKTEPGPYIRSKKPDYKIPLCRLTRIKKGPIA